MALGGGTWLAQNKVLPGTYVNFSSVAKASATLSDRGYAAMPLVLDWGPDNQVFTVTNGDFQTNSLAIFGYAYADPALLALRELFQFTQTLYAYRLNGNGVKAENALCRAKYSGVAGNRLSLIIGANVDDESLLDVSTYYNTTLIETQSVTSADELVSNDFVDFKTGITLEETAKTPLTGGENGPLSNEGYQVFLDKIEQYSFNTMGCPSSDTATINLFVNFTKRLRDEVGAKFQTVIFNPLGESKLADYEGVIEVGNAITDYDEEMEGFGDFGLVYWMTGASAGCLVNKSNTSKSYNGELTVDADYTQAELTSGILTGRLMFHKVNDEVRILDDVNSLVTVSDTMGDVFKANQTIRVCDQIANDMAVTFNTRYLGTVPNDADGRMALWNDVCKLIQDLESIRAVEDFEPTSVVLAQGDTKKAVLCTVTNLNVVNAMAQLYMSVIIM